MKRYLPNFLVRFALLVFMGTLFVQTFAQTPMFHTNPTGGGNTIPFYYTGNGCRGQQVYPVGVFGNPPSGQVITTIYFMPGASYNGSQTYSNFEVYLKQDNISTLSTTYETGMTQVFNATGHTISYTGGQWFAIQLQNPFMYDPNLPLIWEINQLTSGGSTWACQTNPSVPGAYRNYASTYNAASATGLGSYMLAMGFDLAPASTAENDAGVASIDSPAVFCSGIQNIVATVRNYGINQINSVQVNWTFNSILQPPVMMNTLLDTFNGLGPNEAQITLGQKLFTTGIVDNITAWTSMPNNKVDTSINNDTTSTSIQPSLAGNFTINPSGTGANNYTSFADAISDLKDFGVCGKVTFNITPGVYNEQLDFKKIAGTSDLNTISFIADTSAGGVTVEYGASGSSDNYVVQFDGAEHMYLKGITFQNGTGGSTTYRRIFNMQGSASYNTMEECHLVGYATSSSSSNYSVFYCNGPGHKYNKFINNRIDANGQYYGLYFYGNSTTYNEGNEFINNQLNDAYYYGAYMYYHSNTKFNGNKINSTFYSTTTGTSYGYYSYYSYNATEFIGNQINFGYYGARFYNDAGTPGQNLLVANNWITAGHGGYYAYGLYIYNSTFARIVNNTVWRNAGATYGYYGIYLSQSVGCTMVNNLVYAPQGSATYYGIYVNSSADVSEMDYNNVYTNGYYGYYGGVAADLAAWKNAGGGDHSYDFDPAFTTADSLRHCNDDLDNTGKFLPYLTYDYDMDLRNTETPDIGADEFVGSDSSSYSAGVDGELCNGEPIEIGAPITGGTYQWSTGASTPTISVSTVGDYSVIFTSSCGGVFTDQVSVIDVTPTAEFTIKDSYYSGTFKNESKGKDVSTMWIVKVNPADTVYLKNFSYIFPDNGPYEVCLISTNSCDTVTSCQMWQGAVGVNELIEDELTIYPNPASDVIYLDFKENKSNIERVDLYDIKGTLVHTLNNSGMDKDGIMTLNVSGFRSGMYMLKVITITKIITKQMIVN